MIVAKLIQKVLAPQNNFDFSKALIPSLTTIVCLATMSLSSNLFSATLPKQSFSLNHNSYSDGDLSVSGPSIYGRKTLQADTLSLKLNYQDLSIEDSYQDQVNNAPIYSENQSTLAAGVDYLYYDSNLSLNSTYSTAESTALFDIAFNLDQEFSNGSKVILMGVSHGWEDDSDLGLHNKKRKLHFGSNITIRQSWLIYTGFEFVSKDGYLESFQSARRFNTTNRTQLPSGKSEQLFKLISSNDLGKNLFLNTELDIFNNDWGQTGNSLEFNFLRVRSEKLSVQTHFRVFTQDESTYYLDSIVAPTQTYYSDHRYLAKQNSKEFGLTGQWKFKARPEKRINNMQLDLGYTLVKHEYLKAQKISSSGHLLHLNISGTY